jgi:small subunit ribosomal protein S21
MISRRNSGKDLLHLTLDKRKDPEYLAQVIVKPGEGIDAALRRFKKQTMESGILKEARAHEHYEKPSDKRRREAAARLRKIAKAKRQAEGREIR